MGAIDAELTEEQTRILAYLTLFRTIAKTAEKMAVTESYITSHLADPQFADLCLDVVSSTHAVAQAQGHATFYDYVKANETVTKKAQAARVLSESLQDNTAAEVAGLGVRKAMFRRNYLQPVCLQGYEVGDGIVHDTRPQELCTVVGWKRIKEKYYLRDRDYRFYDPIRDTPGLHRIFADVEPTPEAIKAFCDQYGALWEPWDIFGTIRETDVCHNSAALYGYRFDDYLREIQDMKQSILISDVIASGDPGTIRLFCQNPVAMGYKDNSERFADDCSRIPIGYLYAHLNEITCIDISFALQRNAVTPEIIIGKHAGQGHFCKAIHQPLTEPSESTISLPDWMRLSRSDYCLSEPNGMELVFRPQNLAGVLWMMLAYEITGVKTYKQCPACGTWFEISEMNDNRMSRTYCDATCRARAFRKRRSVQAGAATHPPI